MSAELHFKYLPMPNKIDLLYDRASMLREARDFFFKRNIREVDCPAITKFASVDTHIDLIPVSYLETETRYLHSSPEYGMKRLLSMNIGDIYQLAHVFRDEDYGLKHNPEFMMAEWYRMNFEFTEMIDETIDFIKLFIGDIPVKKISYRDAFLKYAGLDYLNKTATELLNFLKEKEIDLYPGIENQGKDELLNMIMGIMIEKELGQDEILVLYHYPASQAALAKTLLCADELVAERFEIYYEGVELCNGYRELTSEEEQRKRLLEANLTRISYQKKSLPIDEYFLESLKKGIPDCCGVAVGFDRLMMLRHGVKDIENVISFGFDKA